jgi:hypothetical protein
MALTHAVRERDVAESSEPGPRSQRYGLTDHGRRIAVFVTKTRIVNPALAELDPRPLHASSAGPVCTGAGDVPLVARTPVIAGCSPGGTSDGADRLR